MSHTWKQIWLTGHHAKAVRVAFRTVFGETKRSTSAAFRALSTGISPGHQTHRNALLISSVVLTVCVVNNCMRLSLRRRIGAAPTPFLALVAASRPSDTHQRSFIHFICGFLPALPVHSYHASRVLTWAAKGIGRAPNLFADVFLLDHYFVRPTRWRSPSSWALVSVPGASAVHMRAT